jgi:hypothetical protein
MARQTKIATRNSAFALVSALMMSNRRLPHATALFLAGLAVFACAACSQKQPLTQKDAQLTQQQAKEAIEAIARRIRTQSAKNGSSPMIDQIQKRGTDMALAPLPNAASQPPTPLHDSPPPPPITPPVMVPGSVMHSPAEFTALIQQAGFQPHPDDQNMIPYFIGLSAADAAKMHYPLPNGLKVDYLIQQDSLIFAAEIRPLRPVEIDELTRGASSDPYDKRTFIEKLNAGIPFFLVAEYSNAELAVGLRGDTLVRRPTLVLAMTAPNNDVTAAVVQGVVNKFILALTPNQELWK